MRRGGEKDSGEERLTRAQAYHSAFNNDAVQQSGNTAMLPINWKHVKGSTLVTG